MADTARTEHPTRMAAGPVVTVIGAPGCGACTFTTAALTSKGITFTYVDVTTDEHAAQTVANLGYAQAPVVIVQDHPDDDWFFTHWSGARPDLIEQLATRVNGGGAR